MLALNSGSSSLKFGLYRVGSFRTEMLLSGAAELIGEKTANSSHKISRGTALLCETVSIPSQREAIICIGRLLADSKMPAPAAVGHRIVHGGPKLRQHCLIDDSVLRQLEAAIAFAPVHMPSALSIICFAQEHFPGLPQVASSTGFAGGRTCPSNLQGIAIGGYPTLRILRPVLRIDRAPACEAAGSYAVAGGVNTVDPVDLHISGCPPTPRQLLEGLLAPLETQCLT